MLNENCNRGTIYCSKFCFCFPADKFNDLYFWCGYGRLKTLSNLSLENGKTCFQLDFTSFILTILLV